MPDFGKSELFVKTRNAAQAEACSVIRATDPLLEKILEVRIMTTRQTKKGVVELSNHTNMRIHDNFATMIHHERALVANERLLFWLLRPHSLNPSLSSL